MGDIGKLRERITIQVGTATNTKGVVSQSWATHRVVSAQVVRMEREEMSEAEKTNTVDRIVITARYLASVTTKMRISWSSQTWDIHAIRPTERRAFMEIDASEVT